MRTLGATEAKTHFLALLTEVETKREGVLVTRNGKPVARVLPVLEPDEDPIFGFYKGRLSLNGDVLSPVHSDDEVEVFFRRSAAQF